ncbi:hypothetical protein [Pseudomonas agarici]|uniref:hypothetical protein n=1 Tax=Pseudomonas agarici TaxID=46677 RepID=UPI0015A4050A|nr:hypothetical protein [Pseudomonas agarici]NWB90318.1 hypothetical protein [Pseudomonas agarici]
MGQFEMRTLALAEAPDIPFDPREAYGDRFADVGHLATINWLVAPSLGIPAKPFEIDLCPTPLWIDGNGWMMDGDVTLRAEDNFTLRLTEALRRIGVSELFCVTARCSASDPQTEIFALDAALNEIPESRQTATAPAGTAFFGPGVVGLRSTGTVTLEDLVAFGVTVRDRQFGLLATVAPAIPGVSAYDQQHYLGTDDTAAGTLAARLRLDGLARENGHLPESSVLERYVHREIAKDRAALALGLEPIVMIEQQFAAILADPEWSYQSQHSPAGTEFSITPATALQHLALAGPIEATALGTSVTAPIPMPFRFLASGQEVFDAVANNGMLPIPLVRITGHHFGPSGPVVTRVYAGLTFCQTPRFSAHRSDARLPAGRDLPGTCDVAIYLERRGRSLAIYPDLSNGDERFPRDDDMRPLVHLAGGNSADDTISGLPRLVVGPFDLPLDSPADQALILHGRDIFGRWALPSHGHFSLDPLPVQSPMLYPPAIEYREHGKLSLRFQLSWDWSLRTPYDLRIAVATNVSGDIDPASGVHLPGFAAAAPLSIRFDGDAPRLEGSQIPVGTEVAAIPLPLTTAGGAAMSDQRAYAIRIPMGSVLDHFDTQIHHLASLAVDAWELVGGHTADRRSIAQHQQARYADPRAPALNGDKWVLVWASRPDGANASRAFFDLQALSARPVAGYYAWRTHETAILDLAVAAMPGDAVSRAAFISRVLGTRDRPMRLAMIRGVVTPHLHKPAFRKSFIELFEVDRTELSPSDIEIAVPGSQSGLEFVMFSAISKAGVANDRLELSNLYAVAVPARATLAPPVLRLVIPDEGSPLAATGCVIAIVSAPAPFAPSQLHCYWDDGEALTSDELLHHLAPFSFIDAIEADRLVPGTGQVLEGDPHAHRHFFILQAPPRWGVQHFASSLSESDGGDKTADMISPRSNLVSVRLVPAIGPMLDIVKMAVSGGFVNWTITTQGIDGVTYDKLAPSLIQLDLVNSTDSNPTATPQQFADFLAYGASIASVTATGSSLGEIQVSHPIDLAGKQVRIAISDPIGRSDVLFLSRPVP